MRPLKEFGPPMLMAFRKRDQRRLRKLNDKVLRACALDCSRENFHLAVYSYVLSKIASKPRLLGKENEESLKAIEDVLDKLVRAADASEEEVLAAFSELEQAVTMLEKGDLRFVIGLVSKGKLKMAATFYAQGMSLGVASEMTGLEKQEILDYAGQTMMFDRVKEEKTVSERMKYARRLISK